MQNTIIAADNKRLNNVVSRELFSIYETPFHKYTQNIYIYANEILHWFIYLIAKYLLIYYVKGKI